MRNRRGSSFVVRFLRLFVLFASFARPVYCDRRSHRHAAVPISPVLGVAENNEFASDARRVYTPMQIITLQFLERYEFI